MRLFKSEHKNHFTLDYVYAMSLKAKYFASRAIHGIFQ